MIVLMCHKNLCPIEGGHQLPGLGKVQLELLGQLLRKGEADGGLLPPPLILVVGDMHVQAMIRCMLELIAMACGSKLAIRVKAWA